jgi:hypothetical protein
MPNEMSRLALKAISTKARTRDQNGGTATGG